MPPSSARFDDEADSRPDGTAGRPTGSFPLTPIRPWQGTRQAETDDERRRRFAQQHAAADAARLAALPTPGLRSPDAPSQAADPVGPVGTPEQHPAGKQEPGVLGKAVRWLLHRSPEPDATPAEADPTPAEPLDVTDTPALDLELADEFHGEPETATAQRDVPGPGTVDGSAAGPATGAAARGRRGLRRRRGHDDEEGPFFPPDPRTPPTLDLPAVASVVDDIPLPAASEVPAVPVSSNRPRPRPPAEVEPAAPPSADTMPPAVEQPSAARQRPRPRPAAARAAASPAAETSTEPAPAGSTAHAPDTDTPNAGDTPTEAEGSNPPGHRRPDISRFLAATEPQPGDDEREPKEPMRRRRRIRGSRGLRVATRLTIVVVIAAIVTVVLRAYVVAPYYIPSGSMEPALHGGAGTNDRILVDKITYHIHDPHQGDIVVFNRPDTWQVPDKTLVKRVVGLPGDVVSLRRGLVYVNGQRLTETYINKACGAAPTAPLTRVTRWTVPMGDYFVMGDNRCDSDDSRAFGPIPGSKIVGRAFLIVWPVSRFGTP